MSRVLMLVINPMTRDTRVEKEAAALAQAGHEVTVVAIAGEGLPAEEDRQGYRILRLPYRRPVKDAVTAPARRVAALAAERERARRALDEVGDRAGLGRTVGEAVWTIRRAAARVVWLAGGAYLKFLRSRILVPEYWRGIASLLPHRVQRPDVIHAHDLGPLAAAVRLSKRWETSDGRPRVVYDSHELYVEQQTRWTPRERRMWELHERRWIRHADLVITVSPGIAEELRRRYGLDVAPTVVLNSPGTDPAPAASDVRSDTGVPAEVPLAVYVGTVKPGRGVERLAPALAHGRWHLAIVGAGTGVHVDEVAAAAADVGAADRLHVLPGVPAASLPSYISTADVGVHPMERTCLNHELALPNKLFDYLFAGLPVAVSDLREMRRLVTDEDLGEVFDPTDAQAAAAAITKAADRASPTASDRLLHRLGWEEQSARLVRAYERL